MSIIGLWFATSRLPIWSSSKVFSCSRVIISNIWRLQSLCTWHC